MSSEPSDPGSDSICEQFPASISNADVDGIAVAAANVVVNLCFRIMVTWSPENVDMAVQSLLFQIYPILLSTLLSVNRQQLSVLDAHFAIAVSSSPLTVYLVVASICDLFGIKTGLYKRIKSHHLIIRALGAMVLPLWAGLSMTTWMSSEAFKDSSCSDDYSFGGWLGDTMLHLPTSIVSPGFMGNFFGNFSELIFLPIPFFLVKSWHQVVVGILAYWEGVSEPWRLFRTPWGWLIITWMYVKCAWCAIDRNHKWFIYIIFGYFDISWAYKLISLSLDATGEGYVLWDGDASFVAEGGYVLSYGQVSYIFTAIPTLFVTSKFVYSHRRDILNFLRHLLAPVRRRSTRKSPARDHYLPFNVTSYPDKPTVGKLPSQIAKNIQLTHRPPLLPDFDYEMQGIRREDRRCFACGATPVNATCGRI